MLTEEARNTNYFQVGAVDRPCGKGEICRKIYSVQDGNKEGNTCIYTKKRWQATQEPSLESTGAGQRGTGMVETNSSAMEEHRRRVLPDGIGLEVEILHQVMKKGEGCSRQQSLSIT